mmetsp:Transcript_85278/g.150746  ORF Transcript_85278/g.150746 Transcript_85278/m.150746 type:complete len:111 (-) Transcript_85278:989-1321(-)
MQRLLENTAWIIVSWMSGVPHELESLKRPKVQLEFSSSCNISSGPLLFDALSTRVTSLNASWKKLTRDEVSTLKTSPALADFMRLSTFASFPTPMLTTMTPNSWRTRNAL